MKSLSLITPVLALGLLPAGALAQEGSGGGNGTEPGPSRWESNHSIVVDGETVEYRAVVGSVILRDNEENATGELFYTGYFRTNGDDPSTRPIIFAYNGGPGSASFWLHMGIMGPRRVVTPNVGQQAPPPYPLVDNGHTVLDIADVVMVDPIGTGFSRPAGDADGTDFWGMDEDAASLTQFIRRFLSENRPLELAPLHPRRELRHDAVRAPRPPPAEREHRPQRDRARLRRHRLQYAPVPGRRPTSASSRTSRPIAVAAEYHDMLPGGTPRRPRGVHEGGRGVGVDRLRADVARRHRPWTPTQRARVLRQMHEYTGLSDGVSSSKADLRVSAPEFEKELLRDRAAHAGPARHAVHGADGRPARHDAPTTTRNPQPSVRPTLLSSIRTCGMNSATTATASTGPAGWRARGTGSGRAAGADPSAARRSTWDPTSRDAIERNPRLEVLLINGIYDFATPYFPIVWSLEQLGLPPDLRDNITRDDFAAGHMMYVEESLLPQWRETLATFITRTSGANLVP